MPSSVTITLHDLISTLDENIVLAEQNDAHSATSRPLFSSQEKMCKYVLVVIDSEKLAIPIEGLAEIGPMPVITPLPNLPSWIHGIINQRGEIISVIDMSLLLGGTAATGKAKSKMAVLYNGSMKLGVGIDQVIATVSRPESDCVPKSDGPFASAEPQVFNRCILMNSEVYQILESASFLGMERLMQYYLAE